MKKILLILILLVSTISNVFAYTYKDDYIQRLVYYYSTDEKAISITKYLNGINAQNEKLEKEYNTKKKLLKISS